MLIVEGAGGLLSPITEDEYVADLALDLGFPLIVVTDNALGTINRTLSSLIVAATWREGLEVAGVIVNEPRPAAADPSTASNLDELRQRCVPPVLGLVGWQGELPSDVDWLKLAGGI